MRALLLAQFCQMSHLTVMHHPARSPSDGWYLTVSHTATEWVTDFSVIIFKWYS